MPQELELKPLAVTVKQARRLTGLGNTKLYELVSEGQLETVTVGRRRLVKFASLERLIDPQMTADSQAASARAPRGI